MSHRGQGGQKSAQKCHVLFEWPLIPFEVVHFTDTISVDQTRKGPSGFVSAP